MTLKQVPLASRMRPKTLDEMAGQEEVLGKNGMLTKLMAAKRPVSLLLFGPPGCGKTTLARLYAERFDCDYICASAVTSKISDIKEQLDKIKKHPLFARQVLLFVDEIHRFNKAQQDLFLPLIEEGLLILIGATTENPSFALNNALISRMRVIQLKPLDNSALTLIVSRYQEQHAPLPLTPSAHKLLVELANGDARHLLNMIEQLEMLDLKTPIDQAELASLLQKRTANYDKDEDFHHQLISALHKSVRGSNPDAALYWLARMLEGGEDPNYLIRRIIRMATEDIGLADPNALQITLAAAEAYRTLGHPEGELALAQALVYLALAPKSNAVYTAFKKAQASAAKSHHLPPPSNIINAPTQLMKELGFGKQYIYEHDLPEAISTQNFFPETLEEKQFYSPFPRGFEREMQKRIAYFEKLRAAQHTEEGG